MITLISLRDCVCFSLRPQETPVIKASMIQGEDEQEEMKSSEKSLGAGCFERKVVKDDPESGRSIGKQ